MQEYETLKTLVVEVEADLNKALSGNRAAATRVRKQMQEIKKVAHSLRSRILEMRATE
jgi:hypothetical protein